MIEFPVLYSVKIPFLAIYNFSVSSAYIIPDTISANFASFRVS
jgi:hypothetical protein